MGRGYFHMIRREALERKNMSLLDQQKEEQRRKSEFRPPKYPASSSSEEDTSDEEITEWVVFRTPHMAFVYLCVCFFPNAMHSSLGLIEAG